MVGMFGFAGESGAVAAASDPFTPASGVTRAPLDSPPFPAIAVPLLGAAGPAFMPAVSAVGVPETGVLKGSLCFAQATATAMHKAIVAD